MTSEAPISTNPGNLALAYHSLVVECSVQEIGIKRFDPDETRTRNLLIRSQTPYPLGHEAMS